LLAGLAVVLAVGLGGCGGSDDDSTSTDSTTAITIKTSSLTRAKFAKEVSTLCSQGTKKVLGKIQQAITQGGGVEGVEKALYPVVEEWISQIEEWGAPKGEEQRVEEFLTALQGDLAEAEAEPSKEIEELAGHFETSGNLARGSELEACGLG